LATAENSDLAGVPRMALFGIRQSLPAPAPLPDRSAPWFAGRVPFDQFRSRGGFHSRPAAHAKGPQPDRPGMG